MFFRSITADMASILKNPILNELPAQTYLAGGTAVALHLGHRLSVDFDFFTSEEIDSLHWHRQLQIAFGPAFMVSAAKIEKNTLVLNLNNPGFSLFSYPYPLLNQPVHDPGFPLPVASLLDLACMKLIAINQRGACKDFIDLKFIIEKTAYSMSDLLSAVGRKYNVGEEMFFQIKKSLVYFDDAERDLNVNMFSAESETFERLSPEEWLKTKQFFHEIASS